MTNTPRWKLNVNERGVKHFHNEIEVWDENDNAPEDIYTVCRQLQREHNAHAAMVEALEGLFKHCAMVHKHWGDGDNTREADAAIKQAEAALKLAKGG